MSKDINDVFNDFLLGMLSSSNATLILELRREWKIYMNAPVIELGKDNCVFDTKRIYDRMKELQEQEDAFNAARSGFYKDFNDYQLKKSGLANQNLK